MNNKLIKSVMLGAVAALTSMQSSALVIGHFDSSRELYGMDTGYISGATQWLTDNGHTLVSTDNADATFLSSVDAFYTGLISSVSTAEISAMQNFVDVDGGFLFIQQDYDGSAWHTASSQILANWGIGNSAGTYSNDSGHYTVGTSDWITQPNLVTGFTGSAHSSINVIPQDFEVLAYDDMDRAIMGVFDAGAGRSSDVFVATDIDFWSSIGWADNRNQMLWENIWTAAAVQIEPPTVTNANAPATLGLLAMALGLVHYRRKSK